MNSHPARYPRKLPEFFIKLLTEPGDLVLDIFAGSNTTGDVAEELSRNWIAFELRRDYLVSSTFRFLDEISDENVLKLYNKFSDPTITNVIIPQRTQKKIDLYPLKASQNESPVG